MSSSDKTMNATDNATQELLQLMDLETLEDNLFRGESRDIGTPRVFGGQVLAQSVIAASRTVEAGDIHSLHAYFLRPGDPEAAIVYDVDRNRDGHSFIARRVVAIQHGRPIFTMAASFQLCQGGLEHQFEMPRVPLPEDLPTEFELSNIRLEEMPQFLRRWFARTGPFDFRPVQNAGLLDPHPEPHPPFADIWFRLGGHVEAPGLMHRALIAYASDFHLVGTATLPHGVSLMHDSVTMASLDHAMWFHRPARVDEWLLFSCDSPSSSGGRGLSRGLIFDRTWTTGCQCSPGRYDTCQQTSGKRE